MSKRYLAVFLLALVICISLSPDAFAGPGQGGRLPYEDWVRRM